MRILFSESDLFYDAMFCGKMMIGKIDHDIRVKLEFIFTHIANQYNAMKVTVLNRTDGEIDKTVFPFKDTLCKIGVHPNRRYIPVKPPFRVVFSSCAPCATR